MFQFSIKAWRAVSNRMVTDAQWRAWAADPAIADSLPEYRPEVDFLPAMQRRRLNAQARLMVDAMWPLVAQGQQMPVVHASHDGEINRSIGLWLSLLQGQGVSPTSFGLSVHNALPGQWSMLRQDMSEATALCVRQDGLEAAFADACGLLAEGAEAVMVVLSDEPLAIGEMVAVRAPLAYAAAFVVTAGDDWRLGCLPSGAAATDVPGEPSAPAQAEPGYWGALDWLRHHLGGQHRFVLERGRRRWCWEQRR